MTGNVFRRNFEAYASRISDICGREERTWRRVGEDEPVWLAQFPGFPEEDCLTSFTFGLSQVRHPLWRFGRPELVVSVRSSDEVWGLGAAFAARLLRGECAFSYGQILRFGERIDPSRPFDHYFLFAPRAVEQPCARIVLPDYVVNLVQAYPVNTEEVEAIQWMGPSEFFRHSPDLAELERSC